MMKLHIFLRGHKDPIEVAGIEREEAEGFFHRLLGMTPWAEHEEANGVRIGFRTEEVAAVLMVPEAKVERGPGGAPGGPAGGAR